MKIELKKISFNDRMSDETNCFVADLWINGKKVGEASNEGHGGCTDYGSSTPEGRKAIEEAEAYYKSLPKEKNEKYDFEFQPSLEDAIDELLEVHLKAKEEVKRMKQYEKAICFGIPKGYSYQSVYWKGKTLREINLISLQSAYNNVKKGLLKGEVVLNADNLKALGVNL